MQKPVLEAYTPLFASPLLQFQVPDSERLNAQIEEEIAAFRAASAGLSRSNQHGWHSALDFFSRAEPGCASLRAHIVESLIQATLRVAPHYDVANQLMNAEGWINVNGRGGYNVPHEHPGFTWSGTYYVRVPAAAGRSGAIEFLDSRTNVGAFGIEGAACFLGKIRIHPQAGWILIFPSYLRHWVYPNEDDTERVSVAFNARFIPRPSSSATA